jgi:hypothetical protein
LPSWDFGKGLVSRNEVVGGYELDNLVRVPGRNWFGWKKMEDMIPST